MMLAMFLSFSHASAESEQIDKEYSAIVATNQQIAQEKQLLIAKVAVVPEVIAVVVAKEPTFTEKQIFINRLVMFFATIGIALCFWKRKYLSGLINKIINKFLTILFLVFIIAIPLIWIGYMVVIAPILLLIFIILCVVNKGNNLD